MPAPVPISIARLSVNHSGVGTLPPAGESTRRDRIKSSLRIFSQVFNPVRLNCLLRSSISSR